MYIDVHVHTFAWTSVPANTYQSVQDVNEYGGDGLKSFNGCFSSLFFSFAMPPTTYAFRVFKRRNNTE